MRPLWLAEFFSFAFSICVIAEEPGNPDAGLAFARANCAECHAVTENDDKSPILTRRLSRVSQRHRE